MLSLIKLLWQIMGFIDNLIELSDLIRFIGILAHRSIKQSMNIRAYQEIIIIIIIINQKWTKNFLTDCPNLYNLLNLKWT